MSFRVRLTLVSAGAVAVAVALASAITYVVVRGELRGQADDALRSRAAAISPGSIGSTFFSDIPNPELGDAPGYLQLVGRDGRTIRPPHEAAAIPVTAAARAVAAGRSGSSFADASVSGRHMRILTVPIAAAWALQIGLPLAETDHALRRARTFLILVGFCGIGLAAALGLAVARTALAPVRRLTAASEHVTKTRDLGSRIDTDGRDELSRLAVSFNTMLAALEESVRAQHQLVADASHELRTPLTSLRTNIEVLSRGPELPAAERDQLLRDVVEQLGEMTALVAELVELARVDIEPTEPEEVRLDLLVAAAIERAHRSAPELAFRAELERSLVRGVPGQIDRAVSNLLANAAKWSPAGGVVEIGVRAGEIAVRDHGPGIDERDLPHVFDRFYRAAAARGTPGAGLGLAIVRRIAESHGGDVLAERPDGGGTRIRLRLLRTP